MDQTKTEDGCSSVPLDPLVGLDALELQMYRKHTEKRPTYCEDMHDAHTVWLRVGVQQFCITDVRETAGEAEWMRTMLAKALANVVRMSPNNRIYEPCKVDHVPRDQKTR